MTLRVQVPLDFRTSYENESYGAKTRKNFTWITEKSATPALPAVGRLSCNPWQHTTITRTQYTISAQHSRNFGRPTHVLPSELVPTNSWPPRSSCRFASGLSYRLTTACCRCSTCFVWWILSTATRPIYLFLVRCIAEVVLIQIIDPRLVRF